MQSDNTMNYFFQDFNIEGMTDPRESNPKNTYTYIDWIYPEIYNKDNQSVIEIGLNHTRASDSIRVKYDSDRNGWIIEQSKYNNITGISIWHEVYFAESYKFDKED